MINIITLHDICNPGSVFQAYALDKFINDNGYECQIIDYVPYYSHIGKNKLKGIIKNILFGKNAKILKKKYHDFIKENMHMTSRRYTTYAQMLDDPPRADIYISGSDQLWNRDYDCGNDEAYYLSFANDAKKISYATSLGKKEISDIDLDFISSRIKGFEHISVREQSSTRFLSSKLNRTIEWVCDPVFLLDKNDYLKKNKRLVSDKYIVIYLSAGTELLEQTIRNIRENTGYKVVLLGGNIARCSCDVHFVDMGPEDFISLVYYAEAVLSSSFHATAFSHIFHKRFGVILPKKNGERIESLLNLSELTDHIIDSSEDYTVLLKDVDYTEVDKKMAPFIENSKEYLLSSISSCLDVKREKAK